MCAEVGGLDHRVEREVAVELEEAVTTEKVVAGLSVEPHDLSSTGGRVRLGGRALPTTPTAAGGTGCALCWETTVTGGRERERTQAKGTEGRVLGDKRTAYGSRGLPPPPLRMLTLGHGHTQSPRCQVHPPTPLCCHSLPSFM